MTAHRFQLLAMASFSVVAACGTKTLSEADQANHYRVTREDLPITVKENGELVAVRETIVRSQVEGQATIIYLIPEGSSVHEGEKLVELDVSDLVEKRATQEISVERAKSAWEQAHTQQQILEKELTTKRNTAASQLTIAKMELEKLLGAKGGKGSEGKNADMVRRLRELVSEPLAQPLTADASVPGVETPAPRQLVDQVDPRNYKGLIDKVVALLKIVDVDGNSEDPLERDMGEMANKILQQADQIRLAMADLKVKEDTAAHSRRLAQKQFITRNELERDELAFQSQASKVTIAWNDLELLINYTLQKDRIKMGQDFENATLELERVDASNDAERKKADFDVAAKEKEYIVAKERFENLNRQIDNAVCLAPTPGLVVYARVDRNRGGGESVREGLQVRDRQDLIILPDNTRMRCIVKVQEAQVDKVAIGQLAHISPEAFPNEVLTGRVTRVAPVADSSNSWMGNDKKVYTTVVDLDGMNSDSRLKSRMAATATITITTVKDVLTVPQQSVKRDRSVNYVWKRGEKGPIAVAVVVGEHNQEKVQVLQGVVEGDLVYRVAPGGQAEPKFDQPVLPVSVPVAAVENGASPPAGDVTTNGDTPRNGRGNRGTGMGAGMRKKLAEMTAEELTQYKESLTMMQGMIDRAREGGNTSGAQEMETAVANLRSALDKDDLVAAQEHQDKVRSLMRSLMSGNRNGAGDGANGGGNGDRPRRGGGGGGGEGGGPGDGRQARGN